MISKPWLCTTCVKRRKCFKRFIVRLLGIAKYVHSTNCYEPEWKTTYKQEPLINFGIDISREAVEKYALENFGRLPQSHIEMNFARDSKIVEETRRFISNENIRDE